VSSTVAITSTVEELFIGQSLPTEVVTDLPTDIFIFLAFTQTLEPSAGLDRRRDKPDVATPRLFSAHRQRRLGGQAPAEPVIAVALTEPDGSAIVPDQNACDLSTPLLLRQGSLLRANGSAAKRSGDVLPLLGFLLDDSDRSNEVNVTFSLERGLLSWTASDAGSARFFLCPDGLSAGFGLASLPAVN
jgi:hypothetical protein